MVNVFKISSSDITNKPFIQEICSYRKPVILSTGASNLEEIDDAVGWIDQCGVPVALLHCILNYPTLNQDANLGMILDLRNRYPDRLIGYSDHTLPGSMKSLEVATVLGARILEKHFTHDKTLPGNDHYHAMDKVDLKLFLANIVDVCELIGDTEKKSLEKEDLARINARRSLVAKSTISSGCRIDRNQLTWKRPAVGISPKEIDTVVNRRAKKRIEEDEIITWDVLK